MTGGPSGAWLPDGRRLHFQHGPIDLILLAEGDDAAVRAAYAAAWARFGTVLTELVDELAELRRAWTAKSDMPRGPVAGRMARAVAPHAASAFVTPMAAVAGAVADEILAVMRSAAELRRASVNNGGDIAFWTKAGEVFSVAIADHQGDRLANVDLSSADGIGGVATSGRHGRSHSLGIADSVTVLAATAAAADAAATLIANAVDCPASPAVRRVPAESLSPDSDLGDRAVVVAVDGLTMEERDHALAAGSRAADAMRAGGLIASAALFLDGAVSVSGQLPTQAIPRRAA